MKNDALTYRQTKKLIRIVSIFIIAGLIAVFLLTSCSTAECLTEPNRNDLTIVWCDYDILYTVDYNGRLVKIKNTEHEMYFAGDYMICIFR